MNERGAEIGGSGFEKLWAPWRMRYIEGIGGSPGEGCIFCEKPKENADERNFIVHRGEACYIIMNIFPYNNGHLMVVPYFHTSRFSDLGSETYREMLDLAGLAMEAIENTMRPDGFNMGMNIGRTAGAGIADHLHLHLVPRWSGDTNFMPVIGCTKVISEALEDSYRKIRCAVNDIVEKRKAVKKD
ncbi:MAG: HIT family protein [Candidatus Latescibacterota bacterium]